APPAGAVPPPVSLAPPATLTPPAPAPKPEPRPTGTAATVTLNLTGQPVSQQIPEVAVYRALRQFPPTNHEIARREIVNNLIENALIDQYLIALKVNVEP